MSMASMNLLEETESVKGNTWPGTGTENDTWGLVRAIYLPRSVDNPRATFLSVRSRMFRREAPVAISRSPKTSEPPSAVLMTQ